MDKALIYGYLAGAFSDGQKPENLHNFFNCVCIDYKQGTFDEKVKTLKINFLKTLSNLT